MLLYDGKFFSASVGDSRAVLGTTMPPERLPAKPSEINMNQHEELRRVKRDRSIVSSKQLSAV